MSDGHTGITDELDSIDVGSDDDAFLEWDCSADVAVEPSPSSSSSAHELLNSNDDLEWDHSADVSVKPPTCQSKRDEAYELAEYIVEAFVPKESQKRARKVIILWKSGERTYTMSCTVYQYTVYLMVFWYR